VYQFGHCLRLMMIFIFIYNYLREKNAPRNDYVKHSHATHEITRLETTAIWFEFTWWKELLLLLKLSEDRADGHSDMNFTSFQQNLRKETLTF